MCFFRVFGAIMLYHSRVIVKMVAAAPALGVHVRSVLLPVPGADHETSQWLYTTTKET
jgi:hypothetical protein